MDWLDEVKWDAQGLVPVIAQEVGSNDVLMFAFMNREALRLTAERGEAVYWSRSRDRLWHKGEESGHIQKVHELRLDCDNDVVLLKVDATRPRARHRLPHRAPLLLLPAPATTARWTAVEPVLEGPGAHLQMSMTSDDTLARLAAVIESRKGGDPDKSYVARLFAKGQRRDPEEDRRGGHRDGDGLQGRRCARRSSTRSPTSGSTRCSR